MHLREQWYVHVENTSGPTKRWFSTLGKLLMYSRRIALVHLIRIREVTSMYLNCGNSIITGRKTEPSRIFWIDGKTIWNIENPQKPPVGTMRLYDISTTSYILIFLTQHLLNIQADKAIWYIYVVWRSICVACRCKKRSGYHEAILAITEVQRQSPREINVEHIPTKERKRLNDKLDPKIREYLEWLSENWEQYSTKEREVPTSSSSSQWSSTSWWSSHEWSKTWKGWQQQLAGW